MRNFKEQRNCKRVNYKCIADFFIINGETKLTNVEIIDISETGARLHTSKKVCVKDKITFKFSIGNLNLTCNATIVWSETSLNGGFISGCKFDLLATDKRLLKLIIEQFYNNNFIYVYKDKTTHIIENLTCKINLCTADIDRLFQYASWLIGEVSSSNKLNEVIFNNLLSRLEEYGNSHADNFKISIYEVAQFKRIIEFTISSLYNENSNIAAMRLEDLDLSSLEIEHSTKLIDKFNKLPQDIQLSTINTISKLLLNNIK